jgi:hypothetical protein
VSAAGARVMSGWQWLDDGAQMAVTEFLSTGPRGVGIGDGPRAETVQARGTSLLFFLIFHFSFFFFSQFNFHFKFKFPSCVEFNPKSKVQFEHTQNEMNLCIYKFYFGFV